MHGQQNTPPLQKKKGQTDVAWTQLAHKAYLLPMA